MQYKDTNTEKLIKTFGEIIKEKRESIQKSQNILAYEYDLDSGNLCRIENGKIDPKLTTMWRLAESLNLPLSDIIDEVKKKLGNDFFIIKQ